MNRISNKNFGLRLCLISLLGGFFFTVHAQEQPISKLQLTETVPSELLATRSVVLFDPLFKKNELEEIQKSFAQTGIDAVLYVEQDVVLAGKDITLAYTNYFSSREIKYLIFIDKPTHAYRMIVTAFNNKATLVDTEQGAWAITNSSLREVLTTAYRNSWISQKKQNLLVNEIPETANKVTTIIGKRAEFFAIDLKVDELAVPLFNHPTLDTALLHILKENYPFKYKLVQPVADDSELRKKGFILTLCVVHSRNVAAKKILGYDMSKSESAYATTSFTDGMPQVKTIPSETPVYKFYVKHIPSGNIFLGTKWDADTSMELALKNHIKGFKAELKIN